MVNKADEQLRNSDYRYVQPEKYRYLISAQPWREAFYLFTHAVFTKVQNLSWNGDLTQGRHFTRIIARSQLLPGIRYLH